MKKQILFFLSTIYFISSYSQNCEINVSSSASEVLCGDCVTLTAYGSSTGQVILDEDFNSGGFGTGWNSTPGAVNFNNPCSGSGVDGTTHAWMDNNTSVPRTLISQPYDLSGATAGVSICFDLLFAEQGDASPCEGPDEADEGVFLEYSIDGGATWITIHYFDPNGGHDAQLINWNNWCFELPAAAITTNTIIRWNQTADSGANYDHWGIDNVQIFQNDISAEVEWIADASLDFPGYSYGIGNGGGDNPNLLCPSVSGTYTAQITTGLGDVCSEDIEIVVNPISYEVSVTADPTSICQAYGECSDLTAEAIVVLDPGGPITFANIQPIDYGNGVFGSGTETVNINIQDLNMTTIQAGTITEICIDLLTFEPNYGAEDGVSDLEVSVQCPSGQSIVLVPMDTAPAGENGGWFSSDDPSYYENVCFVPSSTNSVGDIADGSSAALPITGTYAPEDSFDDLAGCIANGSWTITLDNDNFWGGDGTLTGWSIHI